MLAIRGQTFLVVGQQVCTHLMRNFFLTWGVSEKLDRGAKCARTATVDGTWPRLFDAVKLSCPLSKKTPSKHNVFTVFDSGDGVLRVIHFILHLVI